MSDIEESIARLKDLCPELHLMFVCEAVVPVDIGMESRDVSIKIVNHGGDGIGFTSDIMETLGKDIDQAMKTGQGKEFFDQLMLLTNLLHSGMKIFSTQYERYYNDCWKQMSEMYPDTDLDKVNPH